MKVHQITTESPLKNFTYLISNDEGKGYCVDPWQADQVEEVLKRENLKLEVIINTHEHFDHCMGNDDLVKMTGAEIWAHPHAQGAIKNIKKTLKEGERIELEKNTYLEVLDTPGHTFAHLCLLLVKESTPYAVFTGDTVFNSGVGNCRDGNAETLYQTLNKKFYPLSKDVILYPGHDYIENNLGFTLDIEPENEVAKRRLKSVQEGGDKLTTLKDEGELNTFFRVLEPRVIESVSKKLDKKLQGPKEVFIGLRSLRNKW